MKPSAQDDTPFFEGFAPPPPKQPAKAVHPEPKPHPAETPKPSPPPRPAASPPPSTENLTYSDYLKIHCGNSDAALYWFTRNNVGEDWI